MGALISRQNAGVEEVDMNTPHAYKYPPKSGSYFEGHFIMGGERFDTPQPEAYLFGENSDLNFLGSKPTPFPYPAPQASEPTKTLKSLVNIRKESLRFVRISDKSEKEAVSGDVGDQEKLSAQFNIEFTFDCDVRCAITIYYFCTEEVTANGVIYTPRDRRMTSETFQYKKGANQQFSQPTHIFDPTQCTEEELNYSVEKEVIPIVILCVTEEGEDPKQSHTTMAIVEKYSDGTFNLKPLKQKQFVDGLCYLLQEIYGIENKNAEYCKTVNDEEIEDNGSECVICMCDIRDTLILPCRHLCLCNSCADSLRYQANNCPICRAPFRALLQIKAMRKSTQPALNQGVNNQQNQDCIPQGYEAVSLIEALNGPAASAPPIPVTLTMPTSLPAPLQQPLASLGSQDGVASNLQTPTDPLIRCGLSGSNCSLRFPVVTEDSSAQTDCAMVPLEIITKRNSNSEVSLSMIIPEALDNEVVGEVNNRAEPKRIIVNDFPLEEQKLLLQPQDVIFVEDEIGNKIVDEDLQEDSHQLMEAQSLLEVRPLADKLIKSESKVLSLSTPDSLHLTDKKDGSDPSSSDGVSPGDESDYYTPEDPGTTILTDHAHKESQTSTEVEKLEPKPKVVAAMGPAFLESMSLPGTPLSHASNRSSGDSFSSTSSTRLLLPNQSQETLAEDRGPVQQH